MSNYTSVKQHEKLWGTTCEELVALETELDQ